MLRHVVPDRKQANPSFWQSCSLGDGPEVALADSLTPVFANSKALKSVAALTCGTQRHGILTPQPGNNFTTIRMWEPRADEQSWGHGIARLTHHGWTCGLHKPCCPNTLVSKSRNPCVFSLKNFGIVV